MILTSWICSNIMLDSMVPFTHEGFFVANSLQFFTVWFFHSRPLFIAWFLFCRAIFHVQTGWALLFVLQLIALLFVFPIVNRYEYILMHFKGLTDLVNSAIYIAFWSISIYIYIHHCYYYYEQEKGNSCTASF